MPKDEQRTILRSTATAATVSFTLVFSLMLIFWFTQVRGRWAQDGDEFALVVNSCKMFHPHPVDWFTKGYHDYLIVYPELTSPRSNFIRPFANIKYYIESLCFGNHWSLYLITNYALLALLVSSIVSLGQRHLGLSGIKLWIVGVLAFLTPAFEVFAHLYPNSCLDIFASAAVVIAIYCLLEKCLFMVLLLLTVAVFTKETAHFAPFAASLSLLAFADRPLSLKTRTYAALFPVPVGLLYLLRHYAFRMDGSAGVYVLQGTTGPSAILQRLFIGLRHWPFRVYSDAYNGNIVRIAGVLPQVERVLLSILSAAFWVLFLYAFVSFLRGVRAPTSFDGCVRPNRKQMVSSVTVFLFLAGSLALPVLLNLEARFGALAFPLLALAGTWYASCSSSKAERLLWKTLLLIFGLAAIQARLFVFTQIPEAHERWAMDRSYINLAKNAPVGNLLIVDDMTGFDAGTNWFKNFTGYQGRMVRINSLTFAGDHRCGQTSSIKRQDQNTLLIEFPRNNPCNKAELSAINKPVPHYWHRAMDDLTLDYISDETGLRLVKVSSLTSRPVLIMQSEPKQNRYKMLRP